MTFREKCTHKSKFLQITNDIYIVVFLQIIAHSFKCLHIDLEVKGK